MNNAMKEEVIKILDALVNDIQGKEDMCFQKIAYMREHNFKMELEAILYAQDAYNRSWLIASAARRKIYELMDKQKTNN